MKKREERTDERTQVWKAFYNLPTTALGRRWEIINVHVSKEVEIEILTPIVVFYLLLFGTNWGLFGLALGCRQGQP